MFDGILNVYKEAGYTSFDVVAKLRGILKQKKIGHTGTLDPMAEGVLVVCLGKATKLVDMLIEGDKHYKASFILGYQTDTEDTTGKVIAATDMSVNEDDIIRCINSFVGRYDQIPPMYSAIKVNGKKLYEYAREGVMLELEPRPVEIFDIDNILVKRFKGEHFNLNESFGDCLKKDIICVTMDVHCSKGTYIRSLCRDIGIKLGCLATMSALIRTVAHGNCVENSLKLEQIEKLCGDGSICEHILPLDVVLQEYESVHIKEQFNAYLQNGNKLKEAFFKESNIDKKHPVRVYYGDTIKALYTYEAGMYKPWKMFL